MSTLLLIIRACLSTVLFVSGAAKLADRPGSRQAFISFGLPNPLAASLARFLPLVELVLAVALLPAGDRWSAIATLILFGMFTIAVGIAVARGRKGACHCFGSLHTAPIGGTTLARNAGLTTLAAILVWRWETTGASSLIDWVREPLRGDRTTVTAELLMIAMLATIAFVITRLTRQESRPASASGHEPSPPDPGEMPADGRPPGSPAPDFMLSDLKGKPVGLKDILRNGAPALLTFVSTSCPSCEVLLSDLERWDQEHSETLKIVVISSEGPEDNVAKFAGRKIGLVLQNGLGTGDAYEIQGIPCAVVINSDGTIGTFLANGSDAIKRLVEQTVRSKKLQSIH